MQPAMKRLLLVVSVSIALALPTAFAAGALWIDGPKPSPLGGLLAAALLVAILTLLVAVRPMLRSLLAVVALLAVVFAWWFSIEPSNDRDWMPDVAELATAEINGNQVTVHNVRNFDYRSEDEYDVHWEDRIYDLDKLENLDLFLIYWGSPMIAHTIMSWQFEDGKHLAVSIETRKEKGEAYSAILGFFRQFELYYVVADEQDVVKLRSNYRGEDVFVYRLQAKPELARELLLDYFAEMNSLAEKPRWYNAATLNCTTAIREHMVNIGRNGALDWRMLVNGYLPELGYERGSLDTSVPFEELQRRSEITEAAKAAGDSPEFSSLIRVGVPGMEARESQ